MIEKYFRLKKQKLIIWITIILGVNIGLSVILNGHILFAFMQVGKAFSWLLEHFMPTQETWSNLPSIMSSLWQTLIIAICAAVFASLLAFLFALLGSTTMRINTLLSTLIRFIASLSRNIPVIVWVTILMLSFSQGLFTGFLALFFTTFGLLVRIFIEVIDALTAQSVEALRANGASYMHLVTQSIIPSIMPSMLNWTIYMIDNNIRDSAIIGVVAQVGIGHEFQLFLSSGQYQAAGMVVLVTIVTVLCLEALANYIKREVY